MLKSQESVPFALLRHNDLECYVKEGFGGKPIENWPVFSFFQQYLRGEEEEARANFELWYAEQYKKYRLVPKEQGGMRYGSLHALIETLGDEEKAIVMRVDQRFEMLKGIKERGYQLGEAERIEAVGKNGLVYLQGGHHRAAALLALGYKELPGVLVFQSQLLYNLLRFVRRLKNG